MAATSALSSTVSTAPSFKAFSPVTNTSLTGRIALGVYVSCLAAGVSYCLYNLYQVYQLTTHTGFALNDGFKLLKCRALLLEAREKEVTENVHYLLEQCEDLLVSVNDQTSSYEKEKLLLQLVQLYAKNNPGRALVIAEKLSSSYALFDAAQIILKHSGFTSEIIELYKRAFQAIKWDQPDYKLSVRDIEWCLKIAKAAYDLNNVVFAGEILAQISVKAETLELPLSKVLAFSKIAVCAHKMHNQHYPASSIRKAKEIVNTSAGFGPQLHLILADTYFAVRDFQQMDLELDAVNLYRGLPESTQHLYPLAKLIKSIKSDATVQSKYKNFDVFDLTDSLSTVFTVIRRETDPKKRLDAYFGLDSIAKEELVDSLILKELAFTYALREIWDLSEQTGKEVDAKINFLSHLLHDYKRTPADGKEVMRDLEGLYERCPVGARTWDKFGLGNLIVVYYNKLGLAAESNEFFHQKYLPLFQSCNTAFDKIQKLTSYVCSPVPDFQFSPEQTTSLLHAAENLLPQLSSNEYELALRWIAEVYLQVDRQRSLSLLTEYENSQRSLSITTAVFAAVIGTLYYYPPAAPVIWFVTTVVQMV